MQNPPLEVRLRSSPNTRHVAASCPPATAETRLGREVPSASHKLTDMRTIHGVAHPQFDLTSFEDFSPESWSELRFSYGQYFTRLEAPSKLLRDRLAHAGIAGAGAIGAFLQVIPEVAPNDHVSYAQKSLKTMMDWAGLTEDADGTLTYMVASKKPNLQLSDAEIYRSLEFNPDYFTVDDNQVVLNLEALKARESITRKRLINQRKVTTCTSVIR